MKSIIYLLFCSLFCFINLQAQTIDFSLPEFSGASYDFIIIEGQTPRTLLKDKVPQNGNFSIEFPKEYIPFKGIALFKINTSSDPQQIELLINGEDFSVQSDDANLNPKTVNIQNNKQNEIFQKLYDRQNEILGKSELTKKGLKLYDKDSKFYSLFEEENKRLDTVINDHFENLYANKDIANQWLIYNNLPRAIVPGQYEDSMDRISVASNYIARQLDLNTLYHSGQWENIIDTWVQLQVNMLKNTSSFITEYYYLSDRIKDDKMFRSFLEIMTKKVQSYGKDNFISAITPLVLRSERIKNYEGVLGVYDKARIGSIAPDLVFMSKEDSAGEKDKKIIPSHAFATDSSSYSLLIFHKTGCSHCEKLIEQMPSEMQKLESYGVEIISISADVSQEVFEKTASSLPWKQKYCDFTGSFGPNFENYAVSGTPTLFLIAKDGEILSRTAILDEILQVLKTNKG